MKVILSTDRCDIHVIGIIAVSTNTPHATLNYLRVQMTRSGQVRIGYVQGGRNPLIRIDFWLCLNSVLAGEGGVRLGLEIYLFIYLFYFLFFQYCLINCFSKFVVVISDFRVWIGMTSQFRLEQCQSGVIQRGATPLLVQVSDNVIQGQKCS